MKKFITVAFVLGLLTACDRSPYDIVVTRDDGCQWVINYATNFMGESLYIKSIKPRYDDQGKQICAKGDK